MSDCMGFFPGWDQSRTGVKVNSHDPDAVKISPIFPQFVFCNYFSATTEGAQREN